MGTIVVEEIQAGNEDMASAAFAACRSAIRIEPVMRTRGDFNLKHVLFAMATISIAAATAFGQQPVKASYLDPQLPPEARAKDIVSRMTLDEKVLQMQSTAPAIPRLGVPAYIWWNEALHGVAQGRATVFPQSIGLGATWDTDLLYRISDVISTEARAKYNEAKRHPAPVETGILPGRTAGLTYWSPNINIFRDPRWGRGQETYGEDPFLTGRMAVAFVRGMQGNDPRYLKTVATPKHFAVHSGPEPLRHVFDANIGEYDLVHTYLAAFRDAVVEGKAASVMCVYNSVDGIPGCANSDLLETRLRKQWGFKGYVVSDCGAVEDIYRTHKYTATLGAAAVKAVKAGTDLSCGEEYQTLVDEVKAGTIAEAEIDRALERLFVARFRLGMFDPPESVPFSKIPYSENDSPEHRQLALVAARESMVLLQNRSGILPLKPSVQRIAVIGPSADDPIAPRGNLNYAGVPSHLVTPLEAIKRQFPGAKISYALGATYAPSIPSLVSPNVLTTPDGKGEGLEAEYFDHPDFQGEPKLRRIEAHVNFEREMDEPAVVSAVGEGKYAIRWTGTLTAPANGEYGFIARTGMWNPAGLVRLFLDDQELKPPARPAFPPQPVVAPATATGTTPATPASSDAGMPPVAGGWRNPQVKMHLEAGRKYAVRIEYTQNGPGGSAEFSWVPPLDTSLAEAERVARDADLALVFVGLNMQLEGETYDRKDIELPEPQEKLVEAIIATGKPTVVVLTGGSAIAANYAAEHAAALLEAWYGGEEAGTAIAETLTGANNPAGRLPVTFYKSTDQLPALTDYAMKGHTYRYFKGDPLYSFGYGLSYSSFQYSDLRAQRTSHGAEIDAIVRNTSARDGDEVVQLYVTDSAGAEIRNLRGFERIHLRAGESRHVHFTLDAGVLPSSKVEIGIGGGQPLGTIPHIEGEF
jgi:beta-glucosidase